MSSAILAVPIHGAEDEVLELPKDQLPDDPNEIMQILANELAPLKLWLELAVSYYQQRRIDQFTVVMETSTGEEVSLSGLVGDGKALVVFMRHVG